MASNHNLGRPSAFALLSLSLMALAGLSHAQPTQAQQDALRNNCRSDYMANCSSVKPGGIEAVQCLQRHVAKLSPGCQSAVNALTSQPATQRTTTPPAAAPTAATVPAVAVPAPAASAPVTGAPPPARTATAPAAAPPPRQPARTATPAAAPSQPTAQQQAAVRQSCQSDFMKHCRGVQPGGADAVRCLQRNSAQISPQCRGAVASLGGGAPATPTATTAAAPAAASMPTPAQQSAVKFTCRRDFTVYCRGVAQGGPEAFACLQQNAARLSPDCKTSLAAIVEDAPTAAPTTAAAPAGRPVGPVRRAIRERMMNQ